MKVSVKYTGCLYVKNGNGFGDKRNLNGWLGIIGHIHTENKVGLFTTENQSGFLGIYSDCFINADSTCSQRFACMSSSGLKEQNLMKAKNYNRSTNTEYTTETAISYTACYA